MHFIKYCTCKIRDNYIVAIYTGSIRPFHIFKKERKNIFCSWANILFEINSRVHDQFIPVSF